MASSALFVEKTSQARSYFAGHAAVAAARMREGRRRIVDSHVHLECNHQLPLQDGHKEIAGRGLSASLV